MSWTKVFVVAVSLVVLLGNSAMAEIRNTLRGYSSYKLSEELQRAQAALESAGVAVNTESGEVPLTAAQESVAALIMREAVTNVVRHAQARHCSLRVARTPARRQPPRAN